MKLCLKAQYDIGELARKIENMIYPNDLHVKVAATGCPNDCIKSRIQKMGTRRSYFARYSSSKR